MSTFLSVRRDGPVEYLTLNRPDVRNAFNEHVIRELTDWAATIAADAGVRVVVLSGAGNVFCAGADLEWMSRVASYTRDENIRDAGAAAQMYAALDRLPVPLIGRIHGAAIGGGAGLVAVCDVAVAEERTTFAFAEVKVGIIPAVIAPYVLAKIGASAARELFLTGMRIDARRAREIGLVHAVVPADDVDARVQSYVNDVLGAGTEAIAAAKELLRSIVGRTPHDVMELTASVIAARRASAEGREGIAAFLEKRKPKWTS